nr:MAG TPA: hypothetical protein [Caudoviricetes sp.]
MFCLLYHAPDTNASIKLAHTNVSIFVHFPILLLY